MKIGHIIVVVIAVFVVITVASCVKTGGGKSTSNLFFEIESDAEWAIYADTEILMKSEIYKKFIDSKIGESFERDIKREFAISLEEIAGGIVAWGDAEGKNIVIVAKVKSDADNMLSKFYKKMRDFESKYRKVSECKVGDYRAVSILENYYDEKFHRSSYILVTATDTIKIYIQNYTTKEPVFIKNDKLADIAEELDSRGILSFSSNIAFAENIREMREIFFIINENDKMKSLSGTVFMDNNALSAQMFLKSKKGNVLSVEAKADNAFVMEMTDKILGMIDR